MTQSACSVFGIRNGEEAGYTVLESEGSFELREYAALVVAETSVDAGFEEAGNMAFRRLFGYISGDNVAGRNISMTAPVIAEQHASGWSMSFVLPGKYTLDTAPVPASTEVQLNRIEAKKVAVITYSGRWNEKLLRENSQRLLAWAAKMGLDAVSSIRMAGFNPPYTLPFLRRNEVMIDVQTPPRTVAVNKKASN
jgi:hypothetical protein